MLRFDSVAVIIAIVQSSFVTCLICRANRRVLVPAITGKFGWKRTPESSVRHRRTMASIPNGSVSMVENGSTGASEGVAKKLARPNILELQPYRCARDDYSVGILLDANENAYGPPISAQPHVLERYPDPYQFPLKEQLIQYREYKNIKPENIFVGVGSDEAIDLLMRIFCTPGKDAILITPPTYGMYKVCAKVNDIPIVSVPLTPEFDAQIPQILDAITPNVKLIFLCSPGNPTSKLIPVSDIRAIASHPKISQNCVVVVDEAYIDFAESQASAVSLLEEQTFANVVVLQTLSKAFGLAAIRCGFCIGPADIIQLMNNVKAPYNVNALTSQMAHDALNTFKTKSIVSKNIADILEQRQLVASALEEMDFVTHVYHSDANFILFRVQSHAQEIYKYMADTENVVTRYRGTELHCAGCIRVTVGTPEENQAFLRALQKAYSHFTSTASN